MDKRSTPTPGQSGQPRNDKQALVVTRNQVERIDPYRLTTLSDDPSHISPRPTASSEAQEVGAFAQLLQNMIVQQNLLWREFDLRLRHLEAPRTRTSDAASFEHMTWWMLWGILMLIIGSALTVVLVLIFTSFVH